MADCVVLIYSLLLGFHRTIYYVLDLKVSSAFHFRGLGSFFESDPWQMAFYGRVQRRAVEVLCNTPLTITPSYLVMLGLPARPSGSDSL